MALAHLGPGAHEVLESGEDRIRLTVEPDECEERDLKSELLGRDFGMIALDEPCLFQRPDPAQAGRRRNPGALGKLDVGHAAVGLQVLQDFQVDSVEFGAPHAVFPSLGRAFAQGYYF